jgi:hypothetical protein
MIGLIMEYLLFIIIVIALLIIGISCFYYGKKSFKITDVQILKTNLANNRFEQKLHPLVKELYLELSQDQGLRKNMEH